MVAIDGGFIVQEARGAVQIVFSAVGNEEQARDRLLRKLEGEAHKMIEEKRNPTEGGGGGEDKYKRGSNDKHEANNNNNGSDNAQKAPQEEVDGGGARDGDGNETSKGDKEDTTPKVRLMV